MATTSRDLSRAFNLQSARMYFYFENKDDAVIDCTEIVAKKLEDELIAISMNDITSPETMKHLIRKNAV